MHDDHTHVHDNAHEHCCCGGQHNTQSSDENIALLKYMIEHNSHHGEDLHELYHSLAAAGKQDTADLVGEAMHFFDHGNEKLASALKILGGE